MCLLGPSETETENLKKSKWTYNLKFLQGKFKLAKADLDGNVESEVELPHPQDMYTLDKGTGTYFLRDGDNKRECQEVMDGLTGLFTVY